MKLAILGATGGTGRAFMEQALAKGHSVTALVRDPAKVTQQHAALRVVGGNVTSAADLRGAIAGHDAVVAMLGPRVKTDPIMPDTATPLVKAMQETGVSRLLWISAFGVSDSAPVAVATSFVFGRIIMPLFLKKPYANHQRAEDIIRATQLDWTIVRPLQLVDKATGPAVVTAEGEKPKGLKIARAALATYLLDEVAARAQIRKLPTLSA